MNQEKIGKLIKEKRKRLNITQNELGSKLGVSFKTISKWENGHYMPDISLLVPLSEILEIDLYDLLNSDENKSNLKIEQVNKVLTNVIITSNNKIKKKTKKFSIILTAIIILFAIFLFVGFKIFNNYVSIDKLENTWLIYDRDLDNIKNKLEIIEIYNSINENEIYDELLEDIKYCYKKNTTRNSMNEYSAEKYISKNELKEIQKLVKEDECLNNFEKYYDIEYNENISKTILTQINNIIDISSSGLFINEELSYGEMQGRELIKIQLIHNLVEYIKIEIEKPNE